MLLYSIQQSNLASAMFLPSLIAEFTEYVAQDTAILEVGHFRFSVKTALSFERLSSACHYSHVLVYSHVVSVEVE